VSKQFLNVFSPSAIRDFDAALKCKEGNLVPLEYDKLRQEFKAEDLVCQYSITAILKRERYKLLK